MVGTGTEEEEEETVILCCSSLAGHAVDLIKHWAVAICNMEAE